METYLAKVTTRLRSASPTQLQLSQNEAECCDQWNKDSSTVALDHLVAVFSRRGLGTDDMVMLPVHEVDSSDLTGEFVGYRKDEYGESLHYYNTDDEIDDFLELEEADRSGLAYRLRYWDRRFAFPEDVFKEELIDDRPPYGFDSIAAQHPLDDEEYNSYINNTLQFIQRELLREHQETLDDILGQDIEIEHTGNGRIQSAQLRANNVNIQCSVHLPPADPPQHGTKRVQDEYGVYEGNTVLLMCDTETDDPVLLDGFVTTISGSSIYIDQSFGVLEDDDDLSIKFDECSLHVISRGIAERRESEAFEDVTEEYQELMKGDREISFCSPLSVRFEPFLDLNTYQERAAEAALRTDDVFCIHGPPGTGKTRTLVTIVAHAVKQDDTVLVCAHSNQAVDNIVAGESSETEEDPASLHNVIENTEIPDFSMVRIGSSREDVSDFVGGRYFLPTGRLPNGIDNPDIVASTTNSAAAINNHTDLDFDLVVIDEATQASGPATAVPFGWGNRVDTDSEYPRRYGLRTVLAGDHKQLPPFVSDPEMREREFHTSLFKHLLDIYGDDLAQTLHRQYRMNETIAEFASQEFYDGRLEHGEANRDHTIEGLTPLLGIDDSGDEQETDSSYYNPTEAQYVLAQVNRTLQQDVAPADIGVITGYSGQRDHLRSELRREFETDTTEAIDIETIDKFQGGQREVIIISFVRSNAANNSGFLEYPADDGRKRLNVALTRAKKRLVLIGDWETLADTAAFRDDEESCADTFRRLRDYLVENNAIVTRS